MGIVLDTPSLFPSDHGVPGGTFVIHGTGFVTFPVTRVWFTILHGSLEYVSASFVVTSDTRLTVTIPSPGGPGHFLEGDGIIISTLVPPFDLPGDPGTDGAVTELWTVDDPGNPPFLTSLTPSTAAPGETIAILGGGFDSTSVVTFNGVTATRRKVIDSTHVIAEVPPGTPAALSGDLVVTNLHGPSDPTTFTAIYRSIGLLYDAQLMAVPAISLGPMVDEQFEGIPALSIGPMFDEILVADEVYSDLSLTSSILDNAIYNESLSSAFDLISAARWTYEDSVASALDLTSLAALVFFDSLASALDLSQSIIVAWPESVATAFDLMHSLIDELSASISTPATFDGAIADNAVYFDSVGSSLDLSQLVTSTKVHPGTRTGISECDPSYLATAPLDLQPTVNFSWGILSVDVRAPEWNNTWTLETRALIRRNRGGEPRIQKPAAWVEVRTFKVTFSALSSAKVDELVDFLSQSSGKEITYRDHENTTWVGVITNQDIDVVESVGVCNNEIELEFRGVRS